MLYHSVTQSVFPFTFWLVCIRCTPVLEDQSRSLTIDSSAQLNPMAGQWAESGLLYCDMILEAPVPPPADQVPWFCTCSLCESNKGEKGERGDRGLPGNPGVLGLRGLTGPRGTIGFAGQQGLKGEKGDEGLKGERGPIGPMGSIGDQGFKGDKGDRGEDGMLGEPGPKGEDGQCPLDCVSLKGPPGEPGLPGAVGLPGLLGQDGPPGIKGLKGDPGIDGTPGTPGLPGIKGDPGKEGNCSCKDGQKGEVGSEGSKGNKGELGQIGSQGVAGKKGSKGETGEMGLMGMPGPCSPAIQSAFSAALKSSFPVANQPVVFGRIIYNLQQHYNPSSGVYTAPVNGTYAFSFHLTASTRTLKVGLFWNFQPVVKSTQTYELGSVSQQVLLHLSVGDQVWLQVKDIVNNGMFTSAEASSTFSGFLLEPDTCEFIMGREFPPSVISGEYTWGDPDPTLSPNV
ncbi:otolin-1 [Tachysurus vachellii]|uniref:otolin-1 n=1 Tax=Tachysurus vachellii TaxID=175792 RepID=UPI00296AA13B|nr:otolin-1 [Tachysurus vachellii]